VRNVSDYTIINGQLVSVDELKHYGVPGMKWGIRRDSKLAGLRKKARVAAVGDDLMRSNEKRINRLVKKGANISERQEIELGMSLRVQKAYAKTMKGLMKDLTPEDVKKGRHSVAARTVLTSLPFVAISAIVPQTLIGPIAAAGVQSASAYRSALESDFNKMASEHFRDEVDKEKRKRGGKT
jgi:hypothetical protein